MFRTVICLLTFELSIIILYWDTIPPSLLLFLGLSEHFWSASCSVNWPEQNQEQRFTRLVILRSWLSDSWCNGNFVERAFHWFVVRLTYPCHPERMILPISMGISGVEQKQCIIKTYKLESSKIGSYSNVWWISQLQIHNKTMCMQSIWE